MASAPGTGPEEEGLRGGAHHSLQGTCPVAAASSQGFPVTAGSGARVTCCLVFSAPALKWHIVLGTDGREDAGQAPGVDVKAFVPSRKGMKTPRPVQGWQEEVPLP